MTYEKPRSWPTGEPLDTPPNPWRWVCLLIAMLAVVLILWHAVDPDTADRLGPQLMQ